MWMDSKYQKIEKKFRIGEIKVAEYNSEIYKERNYQSLMKLAKDIARHGLLNPLNVSEDLVIFDGNSRYKAIVQFDVRKFVECNVWVGLFSDSEDFKAMLVSANMQREKTTGETLKECSVTENSIYNFMIPEDAKQSDVDLESVKGKINKRSKINTKYRQELLEVIKLVSEENRPYWPMTVRQFHYQILSWKGGVPAIASRGKNAGTKYQNEQEDYDTLSNILTRLRLDGVLPWELIRDDQRKVEERFSSTNVNEFVRTDVQGLFSCYSRDLLQSQPYFIVLICEKETVSSILSRVRLKYNVRTYYTKGSSSITQREELVRAWQRGGKRPIRLLFLTDLDPAGYRIQDSFVGSLKQDFYDYLKGCDIQAFRIGLTLDQCRKYNIPTDMKAKVSDNNHKEFVKHTGQNMAWELDALGGELLIRIVEDAILQVLDIDAYNEEKAIYEKEQKRLLSLKSKAIEYLSEVADEFDAE